VQLKEFKTNTKQLMEKVSHLEAIIQENSKNMTNTSKFGHSVQQEPAPAFEDSKGLQ